jgi:hypothetical protein
MTMNNTLKVLCVLSALAGLAACGDDSGDDGDKNVDAGPPVKQMDAGKPDSSTPTLDSSTPAADSSTPTGPTTKVTMADFLNATSPSKVQTPNKPTLGIPPALLDANGNVQPL